MGKNERLGRRFLVALLTLLSLAAAAAPQRVASLNLCTDSMLLELAPRDQIASITRLASDPSLSYYADKASFIHSNHGSAEEMIALAPDLILADPATGAGINTLLSKLGYRVEVFAAATTLDEFRAAFLRLGELLDLKSKALARLSEMDRKLAQIAIVERKPTRAIIFNRNGFSPGYHSLANDMLQAARF